MYVLDNRLDPDIKRPLLPCNYFDMVAGSSTGGWVCFFLFLAIDLL